MCSFFLCFCEQFKAADSADDFLKNKRELGLLIERYLSVKKSVQWAKLNFN